MIQAPTFIESLKGVIKLAEKKYWIVVFFPWLFLLTSILPIMILSEVSEFVAITIDANRLISVYSAFSVVGGFLGAASINAMTQTQTICSTYPFSDYLRENNLLDQFIFLLQSIFVISCIISVVSSLFNLDSVSSYILIFNCGFMVYIFIKTFSLIDLMRRLTWYFGNYMILYNKS